jgi:DNA-binding transcriptional LysR family regulator
MLSIKNLKLIKALAQHRSFSRAAAALGVSQPSLTRSLKGIEDSLGVQIFDRHHIVPTVFGQILIDRGQDVMTRFDDMLREIAQLKGLETGEINVVMGPYPADISGDRAVALLSARHPKLTVEMTVRDWTRAVADVISGTADIAVADITDASHNPSLVTELLHSAPLHFFVATSHPLASNPAMTLDDLLDFPWVGPTLPDKGSPSRFETDRAFGVFEQTRNRFRPRILAETFSTTKRIVMGGRAISACIPVQIRRELAARELVLLPIRQPSLQLNYGLITRRGRSLSPAMHSFMSIIRGLEDDLRQSPDPQPGGGDVPS